MIGTTLSHFRITAKLGEGGMGEVYEAEDLKLKRRVALKVVPQAMAADPERLQRFQREAEAIAALNHPNIVTIYSVEATEIDADRPTRRDPEPDGGGDPPSRRAPKPLSPRIHFLTMELIEGESLDKALPRGGWALPEVLDIAIPMADALGSAHEKGIVHRDLKPANVMLTSENRVKVLDFGLAKLASEESTEATDTPAKEMATHLATLTEEGLVMGTAPYMSPEQARGQAVDSRSDIFSLGCMLYEAATGVRPFHGESAIDTLHQVMYSEPEPLADRVPDAPLQLQWILRKALAKAPEDRYQSTRDLAVDLKILKRDLESDPQLATLHSGAIRPPQPESKEYSKWTVAALGVVAMLAVGALSWFLGRSSVNPAVELPAASSAISVQSITSSGDVTAAAISPDGRLVAYVRSSQGEQSLNLRQIGSAQSLELIPARAAAYWGVTFTNDATAVVYGEKTADDLEGALFEISTLGGAPKRLVRGIDSAPTFSPDGRQMAWVRARFPTQDESALMVAAADGGNSRALAIRQGPELFAPIFFVMPSWSPDGRLIATAVQKHLPERQGKIVAFNADSGEVEWEADQDWSWVAAVAWLPEGDGLMAIAERRGSSESQVWFVPYPAGDARQITRDLFEYRIASVTADGSSLLTIPAEGKSGIWVLPTSEAERPRKISQSRLDGLFGFDFTPDGRIVYQTLETGQLDLAIMNFDGSGRQPLTNDPEADYYPRVTRNGWLVYSHGTPSGGQIRRMRLDGSDMQVITTSARRSNLSLSPNGDWVVYENVRNGIFTLWRSPIEGGTATQLTDYESFNPAVSPDGSRLAFHMTDEESGQFKIGIAPIEGGKPEILLNAEPTTSQSSIKWTEDGQALVINTVRSDRANLWRIPLDGDEPEALTSFDDDRLYWFEKAPDGETLVVSRGNLTRDAVLIENFR